MSLSEPVPPAHFPAVWSHFISEHTSNSPRRMQLEALPSEVSLAPIAPTGN